MIGLLLLSSEAKKVVAREKIDLEAIGEKIDTIVTVTALTFFAEPYIHEILSILTPLYKIISLIF